MRKSLVISCFAIAALLSASVALAGSKSVENVSITASSAAGSLGTARSSADSNQSIGCTVGTTATGNQVNCYARNAAGTSASCYSTVARYITAANAITDHSEVMFSWDTNGVCTFLQVSNASYYAPMVP